MMHTSPAEAASTAAEAIRDPNHLTFPLATSSDWEMPGDAYSVVGSLTAMAQRLGQSVLQAERLVTSLSTDGHLSVVGGSAAYTVTEVHTYASDAVTAAEELTRALGLMGSALGRLGYED